MSPKFYSYLWITFFAAAILVFLAGSFTMLAGVVFGFVAFGLVFTGMMCVLPGQVGHDHEASIVKAESKPQPFAKPDEQPVPLPDPSLVRLRSV